MTALSLQMEGSVAVVTFDLPGESVNKFSATVIAEFQALLARLEGDPAVKAAVVISGTPENFIAGADIDAFLEFRTAKDAEAASASGHAMMSRIEKGRVPVVAAIHGACLGGGLEFALACAYRVAGDGPKTVLALPEVQLGLIPGAGGTQRLPRTVGLQVALDMILTGKNVRGRKALQTGLVDELVHPAILRQVAVQRARELGEGTRPRGGTKRAHGATEVLLEDNPLGRAVVFRQAREQTMKKSRGHYPALFAAIEAIQAGYGGDEAEGYRTEARLFGEMAMTEVSRQLIFLFFATTALKKETFGEARPVAKVGVLGTGFMGSGIAAVTAMQGIPVRFKDTTPEAVGRGLAAVRDVLKDRLTKKQVTRQQFEDQLSLVSGTTEYTGFANASLVVEAVFEDLAVKHAVLREAEAVLPPDAVFATNTSTIPIASVAEASRDPSRVIGAHFFSPVHKMPLLEVITTPSTAPDVTATVVQYGRKLGKTVIVVNDAPGFYANRVLVPYLNEAARLLDEGVSIEAIDKAMTAWGFPVGPITLMDEVGLDVGEKVVGVMSKAFGERMTPPAALSVLTKAGRLGRKSKQGFYLYDEQGKKGGVDESVYALFPGRPRRELQAEEIQRRCGLALVNEAVRTLEEGIIRSPRDGDIGAVFGIGFPPFRGGPFRHVDTVGAATIVEQLRALDATHPGRFTPAARLVQMAAEGARFYPAVGKPV